MLGVVVVLLGMAPSARAQTVSESLCDSSFEDCRQVILNLIQTETQEIDVAFWFMQDLRYSQALIARAQAGVKVRVLFDPQANASYSGNQEIVDSMAAAGIPIRYKNGGGILHWKVFLFAGQATVAFTGADFGPFFLTPAVPYSDYIDEVLYTTNDPAVVNSFETMYDNHWVDTTSYSTYANVTSLDRAYPISEIDPTLNFPPGTSADDFANWMTYRLNHENQAIDVFMYRITSTAFTNATIAAVRRGVPVRLITEQNEYRNPARQWDSYNVDLLYAAGVQIKQRLHQGLSHEKAAILYGTGMTVFGSSNWTGPSSNYQAEHNYFTKKAWFLQWFINHFNRKWNATSEFTDFVPQPPDAPVYQSPAAGATDQPTTLTLTWEGGPWSQMFDLYLGTSPNPPLYLSNLRYPGFGTPALNTGTVDATPESCVVSNLLPGTTYYWRVVDKTMANLTAGGQVRSFRTAGTAPVPDPPGNLTAWPVVYNEIDLSWNDVEGETGFTIQRSPDGTTWATIGTSGNGATTYRDTTVTGSTTYYYQVLAFNGTGSSGPSNVATATTPIPAPPPAPSGLAANVVGWNEIDLAWNDVQGETGFQVQRSPDGSAWATVGTTNAGAVSYQDKSVTGGTTYWYQVLAVNGVGTSTPSNVVTASTPLPPPPATPGGVSASALSSTQIQVIWNAVPEASVYAIQRSLDGATWSPLTEVPAGTTTYTDGGLTASTTYYYQAAASNSVATSAWSATAFATTLDSAPPVLPEVDLFVTNASTVAGNWKVVQDPLAYYGTALWNPNQWLPKVATALANPNTYFEINFTAEAGVPYHLWVRARSQSDSYANDSVHIQFSDSVDSAGNPTYRIGTTDSTVFNLEECNGCGDHAWGWEDNGWGSVNLLGPDIYFAASGTHTIRIQRREDGITIDQIRLSPNLYLTARPGPQRDDVPAPLTPTGLAAIVVSSGEIDLSWNDSLRETGFTVQRSVDAINWTSIGTAAAGVLTYNDTTAGAATTYYYQVIAINATGSSAPSTTASATTPAVPAPPSPPTGLAASSAEWWQVQLTWTAVSGASGYVLQRSPDGATWTTIATPVGSATSYLDTGLTPGTSYSYQLAATNAGGTSAFAGPVNATTPTAATEIVLYAMDYAAKAGNWQVTQDANAAGGVALWNPDRGASKIATALANPTAYFEVRFYAQAGVPYHLWLRGNAQYNLWANDSVHIQFSDSVDAGNTPTYRIGTTSSTVFNLEECNGCGEQGWGWEDNGWGAVNLLGPNIYFQSSGVHTIRVQPREDGLRIDQIVLSPNQYLTTRPGTQRTDTTILPRSQ